MKRKKILIIGAGRGGASLLKMFRDSKEAEIVAIVDKNPKALGISLAKKLGIKTGKGYQRFLQKEKVNQIIDATGKNKVYKDLKKIKPVQAELIGGKTAKLIWVLIKEHQHIEKNLKKKEYLLKERNKELSYFYKINKIASKYDRPLSTILQEIVDLIPPAYQYPSITRVVLKIDDQVFKTRGCKKNKYKWEQKANIKSKGKKIGTIAVYYIQKRPEADQGPFLKEERSLLNSIADRLGSIIVRIKSEEKFKAIMQNLPGMVYRSNPDWSPDLILNSRLVCGYAPGEFEEKNITWLDIIYPEDKEKTVKDSLALREGPSTLIQEYRIINKDNNIRWVSDHKTSYFSKEGKFQGVEGIVYDVTKRKEAQINLYKSRERYKILFESSRDAIMVFSAESNKFISANQAALDMFECSLSEFILKTPLDFSPKIQPDGTPSAKKAEEEIGAAVKQGSNYFEWKHKRFDGGEFHATVLLTSFKWEDEVLLQAKVRDVTGKKQRQRKIEETKKRLDLILNNLLDVVWEIDLSGAMTFVSPSVKRLFGYEVDDLLGEKVISILDEKSSEKVQKNIKSFFAAKGKKSSVTLELNFVCKDGSRKACEVVANPVYADGCKIKGFVGVTRDISRRKQAEDAMRLAQLGKLVGGMAHEVNNPLMVVSGRAQLIQMEGVKNKAIKESVKIITEQCQRAKEIIEMLLKFSKAPVKKFKAVDINKALDNIIGLVEHQLFLGNTTIKKRYSSRLPKIKINKGQMQEVLINLINNANEAMPEGGEITVATYSKEDKVFVEVRDTGEGIDEDNLKKLFTPFFSTKEKGTGLGLSVCYNIVKAHGGHLKYQSQKGKGTVAVIVLPIKKKEGGG